MNKLSLKQIRGTKEYKDIPRGFLKSKLTKKKTLLLLKKWEKYENADRRDDWYYGKITAPVKCRRKLDTKMVRGLVKYRKELEKVGFKGNVSTNTLTSVLDRWFEHDSRGANYFDDRICDDEFNSWSRKIVKKSR